jgi:transcriptional regulator with XRE-family HTH domain
VHYSAVSNFELGTREPDLLVVMRYARLAGVSMETLVDDLLNLPDSLPSS